MALFFFGKRNFRSVGAILAYATAAFAVTQAEAEITLGAHVEIPGATLWCQDSGGAGETVIFLHANTGSSDTFTKRQFPAFTEAGFRVVACDRRSAGKSFSATPADDGAASVAEDTVAVMDVLGIERASILGVVGGGFAALDMAADFPDRVDKLIVGASNGRVQDAPIQNFRNAIVLPSLRDAPTHAPLEISPTYRGLNPEGVAEWAKIEADAHKNAKPQVEHSPNTFEKLARIEAETLVVAGGADLLAPPALMEIWAAHISTHSFVKIPEVGHAISWEKPDVFNSIVLKFLAQP